MKGPIFFRTLFYTCVFILAFSCQEQSTHTDLIILNAKVASGNDWPVAHASHLEGVHAAVTW